MFHRKTTLIATLLAGSVLMFGAGSAAADPQVTYVHGRHDGHQKAAPHARTCRTVYTHGRHGGRKVVVCEPMQRLAGPPAWAPAHGWRAKHQHERPKHHHRKHPKRRQHERLYWQDSAPWYGSYPTGASYPAVSSGGCNASLIAGAIGGASGALVGSQVGSGSGRIAATAAGTLIGALAGLDVGRTLDRACLAQTLEYVPDGRTAAWNGAWQATPVATWRGDDGRYCREFTSVATIGGTPQQIYGRACRQPDGSWQIVD